jgi:hypothetical protein
MRDGLLAAVPDGSTSDLRHWALALTARSEVIPADAVLTAEITILEARDRAS